MNLETNVYGEYINITITGTIKTITNTQAIKEALKTTHEQYPEAIINLIIKDSFIITSAVIGFLIKSIKMDKMNVYVLVHSEELYSMLDDMNLIELMNVKKAQNA